MKKWWAQLRGYVSRYPRLTLLSLVLSPLLLTIGGIALYANQTDYFRPNTWQANADKATGGNGERVLSASMAETGSSSQRRDDSAVDASNKRQVAPGIQPSNRLSQPLSSKPESSDRLVLSKNSVTFSVHTFSEDLTAKLESGRRIYYLQNEADSSGQSIGIVTIPPYVHDLQLVPFKAHAFSLPAKPGEYDIPVVALDIDGNLLARANLHVRVLPTAFSIRMGPTRYEEGGSLVSFSFILEGENGYKPVVEFSPIHVPNGFTCSNQTSYTFGGFTLFYAGDAPNRTQINRICQDVAGASTGTNTFTYEFHDRYGTTVTKSVSFDYKKGH